MSFKIKINNEPLPINVEIIPALFVAYVAAKRAEYYAEVDDAREPGSFTKSFEDEFRHAMKHRDEIEDWMENNMNTCDHPADDITAEAYKQT